MEILPGFDGDHQTIAGPDMWTVFDNGGGRAQAALEFLAVAHRPRADEDGRAGDGAPAAPPVGRSRTRRSSSSSAQTFPGVDVFAENLANVEQARPVLAAYPQISEAMGEAIVSAMLGRRTRKPALDEAAAEVNDALALAG